MRNTVLLTLLAIPFCIPADDLVTENGKTFQAYRIADVGSIGIRITYKKDEKLRKATVLFKELTDDFLENYKGDPLTMEIFAASLEKRRKIRALEAKKNEELAALEEQEAELKEPSAKRQMNSARRKRALRRIRDRQKQIQRIFNQECSRLDDAERQRIDAAKKEKENGNETHSDPQRAGK